MRQTKQPEGDAMGASKARQCDGSCEPHELAAWIGLSDATLLGTEPFKLPSESLERLRAHGARAELSTFVTGLILRCGPQHVSHLTQTGCRGVVLGHRRTSGGRMMITGADLAAYLSATAKPAVPTTGAPPRAALEAARRAERRAREEHNLPRRSRAKG